MLNRLLIGVIACDSPVPALVTAAREWALGVVARQRILLDPEMADAVRRGPVPVPVVDGWSVIGGVVAESMGDAESSMRIDHSKGGRERLERELAALPGLAVFGRPEVAARGRQRGAIVREWTADGVAL